MPKPLENASEPAPKGVAERILATLRGCGRGDSIDRIELDRVAAEFGMSGRDLEELASHGPDAADLLYQRMAALGITTADADRLAQGLMRDLQVACTRCDDKRTCRQDLASKPGAPAWKDYCPNVNTLEAIKGAKERFPA